MTGPTDDELARTIFDAFCWDVAPGHGSWDDPTMPPDFRLTFIKCAQAVRPFMLREYDDDAADAFVQQLVDEEIRQAHAEGDYNGPLRHPWTWSSEDLAAAFRAGQAHERGPA